MLRIILFAIVFCAALPAMADEEPLPTVEEVQGRINTLAERKLGEPAQTVLREGLEKTLGFLAGKAGNEQALLALKQRLGDASEQIRKARAESAQLKVEPFQSDSLYVDTPVEELERLLDEADNRLAGWQRELGVANGEALEAYARPERVQNEVTQMQDRIQQLVAIRKDGKQQNGQPLSDDGRTMLRSEQAALESLIVLRRQQLAGNGVLLDLANSQRELLSERIRRLEQEMLMLQKQINSRRLEESTQTVAEQSLKAGQAGLGRVVEKESARNLQLSNYLLKTTERLNQLTQKNLEGKQLLDSLTQSSQLLVEQLKPLHGSLLLSRVLYQELQALPDVRIDSALANEIADIRLYRFELNRQREVLKSPEQYIDEQLAGQPQSEDVAALRKNLSSLYSTRLSLYDQLSRSLDGVLNQAITLQLTQTQLFTLSRNSRAMLEEQMFWVSSNSPINLSWLKQTPLLLKQQWENVNFRSIPQDMLKGLLGQPWRTALFIAGIVLLLWKRRAMRNYLNVLNDDIGRYRRDSQWHTPLALLLSILRVAPASLLVLLLGLALQSGTTKQNVYLGDALVHVALTWLVFYSCWRMLAPGSIGEQHFRWSPALTQFLRRLVRGLGLAVIALLIVVTIAEYQPGALAGDVIGIVTVLVCYAVIAWQLVHLLFRHPEELQISIWRLPLGLLVAGLPVALFVAVWCGYYYTSLRLSGRLIYTLYLLIFWLWLEASLVRGLAVAARRLTFQRLLAKRQSESGGSTNVDDMMDAPVLGVEQISQQSLRLIRLGLLALFLVCLYAVWSDVLSFANHLSNVVLYQYSTGSGEAIIQVPITLFDVLRAFVIGVLTFMLAGNLPGLLEVTVLSRLNLAQGSAYATSTLLSYMIGGIGIVATLGTLGLNWDKLQWLVAALSVGIGFGMQAIFANFVSGLILLFERPMRIGDIVTIENVTGTVHRIRIRATHITDFDRKTVVIPNQTFLTSQLINWTLTDAVTRILLTFNVSLRCDPEKVRQLLLQAAAENTRVMRDPAPTVVLMNYGTTTLNHELRFFVREVDDRLRATDEVNRRVDQLFHENNISITEIRRVEVSLTNEEGREQVLEGGGALLGAAAGET